MKKLKVLLLAVMAAAVAVSFIACGDGKKNNGNGGNGGNGGDKPISAEINMYTAVNIIEQSALQAVADAYMDMQYEKGNDITVYISNNTDPTAYTQNMRNMISGNVTGAVIYQTAVTPEYFGTDKLVDFTGYLEDSNPYIPGNVSWMDGLEPDAYRTRQSGSTSTIPGLSYSSNYLTVFYNKGAVLDVLGASNPAVGADGTLDPTKITWDWMLSALDTAKNSGKKFANPLGLSTSTASCNEGSFNMLANLVNMYLDQYFRDFIDEVHSEEGDYSYVASVDSDWTYDQGDMNIDLPSGYTYNLNKVVELYFNQNGYNPTSERYTEVMENLYALMRYADQEAGYGDIFSRFNETTINYERNGSYSDLKLFYFERLDYVRTYRDAFKQTIGGQTVYPDTEQISEELGWFLMPAMDSDIDGVADNVRPNGGPNENYGIMNSGNQATTDAAVDFMKYLYSPTGQAAIYSTYKGANNAPVTMRQLVKNVSIPAEIDCTTVISVEGDCSNSPYLIFAKGSGMENMKVGNTSQYISDVIADVMSKYFRGNSSAWAASGTSVFNAVKSGFSNYAAERNLIYTDYAKVRQATNELVNSPFNTSN